MISNVEQVLVISIWQQSLTFKSIIQGSLCCLGVSSLSQREQLRPWPAERNAVLARATPAKPLCAPRQRARHSDLMLCASIQMEVSTTQLKTIHHSTQIWAIFSLCVTMDLDHTGDRAPHAWSHGRHIPINRGSLRFISFEHASIYNLFWMWGTSKKWGISIMACQCSLQRPVHSYFIKIW